MARKLYQIHLENGNSVIIQAENEEIALECSGLRGDVEEAAWRLGRSDVAEAHFDLVQAGTGPQNFTIRELHDFHAMIQLTDQGKFEFHIEIPECNKELLKDYPLLNDALEHARLTWGLERLFVAKAMKEYDSAVREAVERERTRLLVIEKL